MKITGTVLAIASLLLVKASSFTKRDQEVCAGQITISETFIGENSDVKLSHVSCPDNADSKRGLQARQSAAPTDVCGNTCMPFRLALFVLSKLESDPSGTTFCSDAAGGGPNPADCTVIVNAMRFFSQNFNDTFTIGTGANNTVVLTYETCETFYVNQVANNQTYCFSDWATIVAFIAPKCENDAGGLCLATNDQWFIDVQANTP
ncbi:hypothetical protein BDP27DRAFT_276664 [Rhodocollybia butyracea]|uniref:Uncharacterized protein n=1 Tax=Rhodocollybia butyracea TaxID=206335 RepID=A0A9P5PG86_9AGAR|nr:hypothetical protein BDP27DRAFT_276664 [Rhodocollybia butyracea]